MTLAIPATDPWIAACALAATLTVVWAAVSDCRRRKIPNAAVLALIALVAVRALLRHGAGLPGDLTVGVVVFLACLALHGARMIGAGDAKFLPAVALFAGSPQLPLLLLLTASIGGVMGAVMLATRRQSSRGRVPPPPRAGVPYGVAIALAGGACFWVRP